MNRLSKPLKFGLSILALSLLWAMPIYSQFSGDIDITFTSDQPELTVGDVVALTLSVTHPAGYQVEFPTLPQEWEQYEVREQSRPQTISNDDGSETTSQVIQVTLFDFGIQQTPPLKLIIFTAAQERLERAAPQLSLTVTSVLAPDDNNLRDIKPQAMLGLDLPWLWLIGGALLTLLLLILLIVFFVWLKRRLDRETPTLAPAPVIDTRPPYVIALAELDRIEALDLPGQGRFKEYYSLVTDCLRIYLGGMYHIPAIDLTTFETQRRLQTSQMQPQFGEQFIQIFTEGDFVKFARFVPKMDIVRGLIDQARDLIEATKFVAVEPTVESTELESEPDVTQQEAA